MQFFTWIFSLSENQFALTSSVVLLTFFIFSTKTSIHGTFHFKVWSNDIIFSFLAKAQRSHTSHNLFTAFDKTDTIFANCGHFATVATPHHTTLIQSTPVKYPSIFSQIHCILPS